jgi:hypothetical protein
MEPPEGLAAVRAQLRENASYRELCCYSLGNIVTDGFGCHFKRLFAVVLSSVLASRVPNRAHEVSAEFTTHNPGVCDVCGKDIVHERLGLRSRDTEAAYRHVTHQRCMVEVRSLEDR